MEVLKCFDDYPASLCAEAHKKSRRRNSSAAAFQEYSC